jgi:hypothetical protein
MTIPLDIQTAIQKLGLFRDLVIQMDIQKWNEFLGFGYPNGYPKQLLEVRKAKSLDNQMAIQTLQ